ncbi:uncharacterized protein UMAG_02113 [Mycosarcoma maydis]|uniref:Uncharacterized protein n=1 Tax=Mycosarcoma maydis TaxID=5270 RepID=A0A0D1CSU0_MYCMD|nr:uncharacterized protein UMAG_02113 [Ustilago maydis 521]KIS69578.1 hypothetical protein UMAG_02113 [Ustilago maydis 521]|eukprot:XP_011388475.1 hypothetical protein UMAG_02113 [Ustilago maydis 521]
MAITLQTVLPQKILPRAPSPNATSPNPGVRSTITQFIPASPDASLDQGSPANPTHGPVLSGVAFPSSSRTNLTRVASNSFQGGKDGGEILALSNSSVQAAMSPRMSMSAGAGSRRGIAHSRRVLGVDKDTTEAFALSQLTNGKVDVSFEGTLAECTPSSSSQSMRKGKGKAWDEGGDSDKYQNGHPPLFDIDLESRQQAGSSSFSISRAGRLLQMGTNSMPWNKSKSNDTVPAYEEGAANAIATPPADSRDDSLDFFRSPKVSTGHKSNYSAGHGGEEDDYHTELGAFDEDREQLLYPDAEDDAGQPGYFASGDRHLGYNSLQGSVGIGGYGGAVGFEPLTWAEGGWMLLSSLFVVVLIVVAILISIDVIDWPGDGIGKN